MSRADPGAPQGRNRRRLAERAQARHRFGPVGVGLAILGALRDPVIVIFVLAGTFDLLSGDRIIDGAILLAVAVALGWDAAGRPPAERAAAEAAGAGEDAMRPARGAVPAPAPSSRGRAAPWRSPMVLLGGVLYVVLVAGFARYSLPATLAVWAPAAAGVAVAWRRPVTDGPDPAPVPAAGAAAWAAVFVALALWELAALLLQPSLTTDSWAHPTISVLLDPILATHLGRTVVLSLWLTSGWWLLRR
jgi:hypothetical protein